MAPSPRGTRSISPPDALRDAGVTNALLHGGTSTVAAIGAGPWRIRVAHTDRTIELADESMSVSATFSQDKPHIVDPRTGAPVVVRRLAVCTGSSATETDAWATALAVLGYRPPSMPDRVASSIEVPHPGSTHGS